MNNQIRISTSVILAGLSLPLAGCIGYNSTLFMTKTNVGLDVDSKPPTMEVSIARREAVISPTFAGGQTPPVLASFVVEPGPHFPLFPRISQTFSGGDASVEMATLYNDEDTPEYDAEKYDSAVWLKDPPKTKVLGMFPASVFKPNSMQPLVFGTDTSFGLKVAWSGMTAQFPDTVRLGLNRKEFALAPLFLNQSKTNGTLTNSVKMPSFLATMDNSADIQGPQNTGIRHVQYFATGVAAEQIALHPEVRRAMLQRLDPNAPEKAAEFEAAQARVTEEFGKVDKILNFVKADNNKVDKDKLKSLTPNTGLGDQWVQKYSNLTLDDLGTALKGKYRSSVKKLAGNIK